MAIDSETIDATASDSETIDSETIDTGDGGGGGGGALIKLNLSDATVVVGTNGFWNNARFTNIADLLDFNTEASTGWSLTLVVGPSGTGPVGEVAVGSGDADWVDELLCVRTGHFVNTDTAQNYRISGLSGSSYTIKFFASRSSTGDFITEYSVDGFATFEAVQASDNTTEIAEFVGVAPAGGVIDLEWRKQSGETSGSLSAIQIEETG